VPPAVLTGQLSKDARDASLRLQGSAGTAVVTTNEALLWTDGRYFLQAERELGSEWRLMRAGMPGTPEVAVYLKDTLPSGARVGIDPQVRTRVHLPLHTIYRIVF